MTTVSSATSTNASTTSNLGMYTFSQPQNTIMSLFESGWANSGVNGFTTPQLSSQTQAIPSTLNENPSNLASMLLENHYLQAYQNYMLSEATPQAAQTTTTGQPQATAVSEASTVAQSGPTIQDMYNATQIANAITGQFGGTATLINQKQGLPTDFLIQSPAYIQTGLNYSA